jgi:hypothetical protein
LPVNARRIFGAGVVVDDERIHGSLPPVRRHARKPVADSVRQGRQFVLAAKVLAGSEFAAIQWHFIAALSPWQGGVYERLVALVKRAFKACIGRRILTEIEFRTFAKKTEACLNCRPLTFVSTEGDGFMPLRPADFLVLHAELPLTVPEAGAEQSTPAEALRRRWKAQRAYLDHFWRRFASEYLTTLRDKAGWSHKKKRPSTARSPRIGEPVLVEIDFTARNLWPMAIIDSLEVRAGEV